MTEEEERDTVLITEESIEILEASEKFTISQSKGEIGDQKFVL